MGSEGMLEIFQQHLNFSLMESFSKPEADMRPCYQYTWDRRLGTVCFITLGTAKRFEK